MGDDGDGLLVRTGPGPGEGRREGGVANTRVAPPADVCGADAGTVI